MGTPAATPLSESFGTVNLPLGGKHGYKGVHGGQGPNKDGYQGYTPRKTHFTKIYKTAHEAAVNRALLKHDLEFMGSEDEKKKRPRKPRCDKVLFASEARP